MQSIRHFLIAVQFFTRVPITGRLAQWVGYSPAMLQASAAHFPGIGYIVGISTAFIYWGLSQLLGAGHSATVACIAAIFSTIFSAMLTGGFHEDGLADTADALGGSYDKEKALIIMKDSRIGSFGAIALVLSFMAKISLLTHIGTHATVLALWAILGSHILSRFWPLLIIRLLPHVGDDAGSKSKPLANQIHLKSLFAASIWVLIAWLVLSFYLGAWSLMWPLLASFVAFLYAFYLFHKRLQGFTGDCLGSTQQITEIAFLLGYSVMLAPSINS